MGISISTRGCASKSIYEGSNGTFTDLLIEIFTKQNLFISISIMFSFIGGIFVRSADAFQWGHPIFRQIIISGKEEPETEIPVNFHRKAEIPETFSGGKVSSDGNISGGWCPVDILLADTFSGGKFPTETFSGRNFSNRFFRLTTILVFQEKITTDLKN